MSVWASLTESISYWTVTVRLGFVKARDVMRATLRVSRLTYLDVTACICSTSIRAAAASTEAYRSRARADDNGFARLLKNLKKKKNLSVEEATSARNGTCLVGLHHLDVRRKWPNVLTCSKCRRVSLRWRNLAVLPSGGGSIFLRKTGCDLPPCCGAPNPCDARCHHHRCYGRTRGLLLLEP